MHDRPRAALAASRGRPSTAGAGLVRRVRSHRFHRAAWHFFAIRHGTRFGHAELNHRKVPTGKFNSCAIGPIEAVVEAGATGQAIAIVTRETSCNWPLAAQCQHVAIERGARHAE
jgi:hypothetical protein